MSDESTPTNLCRGSGKPTRDDGSCGRCAARDVAGEWLQTDPTEGGTRFVLFPVFWYRLAVDHEPKE